MKKHTSEEAYYERLRNLAQTKKTSLKESRTLGTLIDYKRAADGIAYGIIKEQHHYYVKKAGLKQDPSVSDFAYIGGLENITGFQYKSLSEADKQRNMMFRTINEAVVSKPSKTGSKKRLNEDKAGQEIDNAESKLGDLDAATASAEAPAEMPAPEGGDEMAAGLGDMPADSPEGGATPEMGGDEMGAGAEGGMEDAAGAGDEMGGDPEAAGDEMGAGGGAEGGDKSITVVEIEKMTGKLTNLIRKTDLEPTLVKSLVNSLLTSFEDKLDNDEIEIEDKQEMVDKIMGRTSDNAEADLEATMPAEDGAEVPEPEIAEAKCSECGTFAQYAESRGYGSAESLMECGEEEVGNLVSGYANAHGEGQNDGDMEGVALVIKIVNPEILNQLRGDYGHEEYADKLQPHVDGMNESSEEDNIAQLNELFGSFGAGMKNVFNKGAEKIGGAVQAGAEKVGNAAKSAYDAGAEKVNQVKQGVQNAAQGVQKAYHTGALSNEMKKANELGNQFAAQIKSLNDRMVKAGQEPVNVGSLLTGVKNQINSGTGVNVAGTKAGKGIRTAEGLDPANVETQPMMEVQVAQKAGKKLSTSAPVKPITEEEEPEEIEGSEEKKEFNFAPEGQVLGGAMVKPDGAPTTGVDININPDKSVNISMNENEAKLRKYVRKRLEEMAGLRKPVLTENKKSAALVKLDNVIAKQFSLFEGEVIKKKGEKLNEVFGFSIKEKFASLDPNNANEVNKLFSEAYRNILTNPQMGAIAQEVKKLQIPQRYELLKLYVENGGGTLRLGRNGVEYKSDAFKSKAMGSQFAGGGTQGKTTFGGTVGESNNVNEMFGFGVKERFAKLDPNNAQKVEKLFKQAFNDIMINPRAQAIAIAAGTTPIETKYDILRQYVENGGGTLRLLDRGTVKYEPQQTKDAATRSQFAGGGTQGQTQMGGAVGR